MLKENKTIEFKREFIDDIKRTVIAFANTDGGRIYIGIEDDGTVVGVTEAADTVMKIHNSIRDAIRPDVTLFCECKVEKMDNMDVIVVEVQRGTARPYYLSGKGIRPEGVFVRQGASTVPASETAIVNMIKETSGDRYEIARSLNQQLTFRNAEAYFEKRNTAFGELQKRTLHLIGEDGMYTNLALVLSDQCTHTIKLAVFQGSIKTIFKDRREFHGSLFKQLDEVYDFIDRYNSVRSEFEGLHRIDKRDYPIEAIRETLLNAIVHRDYGLSPSTLISIFDDRIEFVTIGGLIKGVTLGDILLGVSAPRNPYLAELFYRLKLIEAYGTGIPKIRESYKLYDVKPCIELSDNAFKITLPNTNYKITQDYIHNTDLSPREQTVLSLFNDLDTISRMDIEKSIGVSQATAIIIIREMINKGLMVKEGSGKKLRYRRNS